MACTSVGSCRILPKNSPTVESKWRKDNNKKRLRVSCVFYSSAASDPYKTLRIQPDASQSEVKKAFRQLALQYHPDVCRGSNCSIQFQQINEAYDFVMGMFGDESEIDDTMRGVKEQDWELWEEWMGWEGAGIRDYSSHINPYI